MAETINGPETRTTGSNEPSCGRCGGTIRGSRRRNGYCSDACRMADRRAIERADRRELVEHLKWLTSLLERELLGTPSGSHAEEGQDGGQ